MNERIAREMGITIDLLESRHRAIEKGEYPDLYEPRPVVDRLARISPLPGVEGLKAVMGIASRQLRARHVAREDAEKLYLRRTAEEIIRSGKVATHKDAGIHGCQDYAIVALALLRARNVPAESYQFIRIEEVPEELSRSVAANHSIVLLQMAGKHYRIDLSKKSPFTQVSQRMAELLIKNARVGKDAFDVGITSAANAFHEGPGRVDRPAGNAAK